MRSSTTTLIAALLLAASASGAVAQAAKPAAPAPKAAAPAPAAAPPATPGESDARCLLAMAVLSQDKQRQELANMAVFFFAGRLTARGVDMTTAVKDAEKKINPPQIPAELKRCAPMVQSAQSSLQKTFAPPPGSTPPATAAPPAAAPPKK